jgi:hypothetical protein
VPASGLADRDGEIKDAVLAGLGAAGLGEAAVAGDVASEVRSAVTSGIAGEISGGTAGESAVEVESVAEAAGAGGRAGAVKVADEGEDVVAVAGLGEVEDDSADLNLLAGEVTGLSELAFACAGLCDLAVADADAGAGEGAVTVPD